MGSTRVRAFLKGIRYISQMFEDEKQEFQIGLPTDVKHVAHIGWDGPSVESPSWMKEFTTKPDASHSAPLDRSGNPIEHPELKWDSQDLSGISNSLARELPELPKSSRSNNSTDNSVPTECDGESCPRPRRTRDPNKPRSSRRHQRKESSEGGGSTSEDQNNDDLDTSTSKKTRSSGPKKPRRRKPNENKAIRIPPVSYNSPFSDPGPGSNTDNLEQ